MQKASPLQCPSCNRYAGPVHACPYCGATMQTSPLMRITRIAAILLATAGLLLLYLTARHIEPPLTPIGTVTPAMNFAHIRVAGLLTKRPYLSRDNTRVSFTVTDNTGDIRVLAYRDVARDLVETKQIPAAGDHVDIRGSLSISADAAPKLYLKASQHLTITPKTQTAAP